LSWWEPPLLIELQRGPKRKRRGTSVSCYICPGEANYAFEGGAQLGKWLPKKKKKSPDTRDVKTTKEKGKKRIFLGSKVGGGRKP